MEDGLRDFQLELCKSIKSAVLILVLMEDDLRAFKITGFVSFSEGLNPCFNGRWSASYNKRKCNY